MAHPTIAGASSIAGLLADRALRVIGPKDAEYDQARKLFYGNVPDRRPAAIVRPANATEVAGIVSFARERGIELAVRSGGHSVVGHSTSEGGIVLDLAAMKGLEIDVADRTAWAETGLTAAELTTALGAHGLAIGFGDTGSVGIGGITLGGGVGYLVRKFGLTIDSLLAADIVTAEGRTLRVDATSHPDLFWAIRGGGGNFGVATRFQYRLHEVPQIVGGMLLLPATVESVAGFIAAAEAAPEELSTIANVMIAPPMPFVPAEHHGKLGIMALMCYAGDAASGERAVAPFRALATPFVDLVKRMTYPEMYPPEDPAYHPVAAGRTLFVDRIDRGVARTILEHIEAHMRGSKAQLAVAQLRVLGGAAARVPADATAYAHRASRIMVNVAALYDPASDDAAVHEAYVDEFAGALRQRDTGVYVNFLTGDDEAHVRAAYPGGTWDRLASVKRRYDPTNLFRLNQNIPPA
ncbi:MAG TPA: FAD-binding oxidoreductase [Candidatus Limnocylindria bacterium]|nr:FAD-binding oxidoreductase [Candidatus Limnocylindria bacterium]